MSIVCEVPSCAIFRNFVERAIKMFVSKENFFSQIFFGVTKAKFKMLRKLQDEKKEKLIIITKLSY